jgi:hypothetical protein
MNTDESRSAQTAPQAEQNMTQEPVAVDTQREEARAALGELDDRLEQAKIKADEAFYAFLALDDMADEAAREAGCDDAIERADEGLRDARAAVRRAIEALNADARAPVRAVETLNANAEDEEGDEDD